MEKTINDSIKELKTYLSLKKELDAQIKALEDQIKEYMASAGIDEIITDDLLTVVRYKEVISNRFDSTAFKSSEWAELYKEYTKEVHTMRFTVN